MLNIERIRMKILENKRGGSLSKSELLDTIVELYSKSLKINEVQQ